MFGGGALFVFTVHINVIYFFFFAFASPAFFCATSLSFTLIELSFHLQARTSNSSQVSNCTEHVNNKNQLCN